MEFKPLDYEGLRLLKLILAKKIQTKKNNPQGRPDLTKRPTLRKKTQPFKTSKTSIDKMQISRRPNKHIRDGVMVKVTKVRSAVSFLENNCFCG